MSSGPVTVVQALAAVMNDVQAVKKEGYNEGQRYHFRGIDAVVNAVGPALRTHGVVVTPRVESIEYATLEVGAGEKRRGIAHVRVVVAYTFHGPEGDTLVCSAPGEAMDSGDKATPKAMSVAYRTALLQALCLPTDDPDPDAFSPPLVEPQRSTSAKGKLLQAKAALWKYAQGLGWDREHLTDDYQRRTGNVIGDAAAEDLSDYLKALTAEHEPADE